MFDLDLKIGDRIKYIGHEEYEDMTFEGVYEVIEFKTLGKRDYIVILDDANDENYLTIPYYRKNYQKVEVTIRYSEDGTFTTETNDGVLEWGVAKFYTEIEKLETLLDSLGVGYEEIIVE